MSAPAEARPTPEPERCERCNTPVVRDPSQPCLCAGCAPRTRIAEAVHKTVAAMHAKRGSVSTLPEVRRWA